MRKWMSATLAVLTLFAFAACGPGEPQPGDRLDYELLDDNQFRSGFNVLNADNGNSYPMAFELYYGDAEKGNIVWQVAQWGCKYGLGDVYGPIAQGTPEKSGNTYLFQDPSKLFAVNPTDGELTFEVNASKEYDAPRKSKEAWPHLLISQGFSVQPELKDLNSLVLKMDLELLKSEKKMTESEYDPGLHAAQFLMYLTVNSTNAADAGEYMWFGIPVYDNRYQTPQESGMVDAGTSGNTGKFIYGMPTNDYIPGGINVGEPVSVDVDLLPYMERALERAHNLNKLLNTSLDDLVVTGMNVGWEIPGTFDVSMKLSNYSLIAHAKHELKGLDE